MTVVAIPVRYGTDRFGKVTGGTLDSDGRAYPQPASNPEWMGGTTMLLTPPEADPAAAAYGYRPNALLSGSRQQLYGQPLDGWVYCDPLGFRWLIRLTLPSELDVTGNSISIAYTIVRFGQLTLAPIPNYPSASGTLSLSDIGQSPLTLEQTGGTLPAEATWQHTDCAVTLVSIDSTGANAVLCIWSDAYESFAALSPYGLDAYPQGFLKIACTAAAISGEPPSLTLSVLKTLAQTVGVKHCTNATTESPFGYCEIGDTGTAFIQYRTRSIDLTSGITGIIAALYYHDNALASITLDVSKAETGAVDEPTTTGCGTYFLTFNQTAARETVYTYAIKRDGITIATATVTSQFTRTSDYAYSSPAPFGYPTCRDQQTVTVQIGDETVTGSSDTTYDDTFFLSSTILASGVSHSGCEWFTFNTRFYNDDFLNTYTVPGEGTFTPTARRYAYNLLGLAAVKNVDLIGKTLTLIGKAVSPAGIVAATAVGSGQYGAYNARTEEAVAGTAAPVGYV